MSFAAKFVAKRMFKEKLANSFGQEDPYFESVPATRLNGTPNGKMKKRRKALPPGISVHDGRVLTKVKRRAWRLDMCLFSICGVRFGWGSAIAIVPAIGDVIDALLSLMVFRTCCQVEGGLPSGVKAKMMLNIVVDFAIGLIPFAGDVADAMFRCNTKNAIVLETHLREVGKKNLRKAGKAIPATDPSDPDFFEEAGARGEPVGRQPRRHESMSRHAATSDDRSVPTDPRSPADPPNGGRTDERRPGRFSSWLWTRYRDPDPEMGQTSPPEQSSRRVREERH